MSRPKNILFIMTDQQRHDTLGCYGNSTIHTPHLDKLAADGITYKMAYSTCPACIPARGCCLTGLNQWNLGSLSYSAALKEHYPVTLPQLLAAEDFVCLAVGKNHFQPQRAMHGYHKAYLDESARIESEDFVSDYLSWFEQRTGHKNIIDSQLDFNGYQGKPYPYEENVHPTTWVKNKGLELIGNMVSENKSFFIKLSFARPHSPYDAPRRWFDYYLGKDLGSPAICDKDSKLSKVKGDSKTRWHGAVSAEEYRYAKAGYYGNVSFIDQSLGEVFDYLRQLKIYDDTMIIFTSDHGDMLGDHNLWRKTYAYEGSAHIPMIIKPALHGNYIAGNVVDTPSTLYDILPTVMKQVAPDAIYPTDGIDLLTNTRRYLHGEYIGSYSAKLDMQYVVSNRFKLIWYIKTRTLELYDIKTDPTELKDLSGNTDYSKTLQSMLSFLGKINTQRGVKIFNSNDKLRHFAVLPYTKYATLKIKRPVKTDLKK